jgi:hypothetical protein
MNYKMIKDNPIEILRIKHNLSQKDFFRMLDYNNVATYRHHMNEFTEDILKRIRNIYEADLTMEVIAYLKYQLKQYTGKNKPKTKQLTDHLSGNANADDLLTKIK